VRRTRKRLAISELFGSLIMIAVTLIAGIAVFGFINGQAGTSARAVGNSAATNSNFLNEREVVVYATVVGATPSASANVWVYNSGIITPLTISQVLIFQGSSQVCPSATWTLPSIQQGNVALLSTTNCRTVGGANALVSPNTYVFEVIGTYGSNARLTIQF